MHVVPVRASCPSGSQHFLTSSALPKRYEAYHLDMRRLHPGCSDSESFGRSLPADILLREEPEEEEEEEDGYDRKEDDDDDDRDDGYSE
jgi:hypothetical protein